MDRRLPGGFPARWSPSRHEYGGSLGQHACVARPRAVAAAAPISHFRCTVAWQAWLPDACLRRGRRALPHTAKSIMQRWPESTPKGAAFMMPTAKWAATLLVKERCATAGAEGKFSAHSLRAGSVTEASRQSMSLSETMAMTGHHSVPTVMGYFRDESALGSKVSRMFENARRRASVVPRLWRSMGSTSRIRDRIAGATATRAGSKANRKLWICFRQPR